MRLDRSRVIMASSMVSGNQWSCVHIILETGDGLYADSIGWEVPHFFEDTFSNVSQPICKVYDKNMTLSNPCKFLINSISKKCAQIFIFLCKIYLSKKRHDCMWACYNIFCNHDVRFYNSYRNYSKTKNDSLLRLGEWLAII